MTSLKKTENICPAIINSDEKPLEMTADEFQRTLITWFEERGLLSELRAHLRKQMIGIIKDTNLGQTASKNTSKVSPKGHVTNLLIAEYLLKHRYHYSLSVFSTEVPYFINMLPDFAPLVNPFKNDGNMANLKNFSHQNFCDILETLGFLPDSNETEKLHDLYFRNNDQSLLNCMINILPKLTNLKIKIKDNFEDTINLETWLKDIHNLLLHYEVNTCFLINLRNQIKLVFEKEFTKIKNEEENRFKNKQDEINNNLLQRETEIKRLIKEMETTYNKERKKLSEEHMRELKTFEKSKIQYKQLKNEYELKNESLQKKEDLINQREIDLEQQLEILKTRTKVMQNVYDSVIEENKKIIKLRQELQLQGSTSDETLKHLNHEYSNLRAEINTTKKTIENIKKTSYIDKEIQTLPTPENSEHQLLKQMLERIQNENAALRILNNEQQRRLDDISIQNSSLIHDLENCQTTISILTRTNARRGIITVPPIMPSAPFPTRPQLRAQNSQNGGGENLGFVPQPHSPPSYRYAYNNQYRDYLRRKSLKVSPHRSSSSSSPTEDILIEARERLQRLERESEDIDLHYRTFRERQSRENMNTLSMNNIPESIRAQSSANREAVFTSLRPTFNDRISELPSTSSVNLNWTPSFNFTVPRQTNGILEQVNVVPSTSASFKWKPNLNFTNSNKQGGVLDKSRQSSSYVFNFSRQNDGKSSEINKDNLEETREDNRVSAGPSVASSGISQLQNLSISTIEISSDSEETNDHQTKE